MGKKYSHLLGHSLISGTYFFFKFTSRYIFQQFKWTVKEAQPLFKGRSAAAVDTNGYHDISSDSMENGDVTYHHHGNEDHDVVDDSADDQVWHHHDDIIRSDQPVEEDLPARQTTRSMLAVFQSMEDVNRPPPTPEYANQVVKQASPVRTMSIRRGASPPPTQTIKSSHYNNHVNGHHSDGGDGYQSDEREGGEYNSSSHDELYRDYDQHGGEFENDSLRNPDVMREDVTNVEELPEQGTTKNLLAKFQALTAI